MAMQVNDTIVPNYGALRKEYRRLQQLAFFLDGIGPETFNELCFQELEFFGVSPNPQNWVSAAIEVISQIEWYMVSRGF